MPDTHDYPLAQALGTGNLIHHARPAALPGRIETRCGQEGEWTGRDGSFWCPDCLAMERAEADTRDERGGGAAMEVARYADQYVAYADGDSDTAPGRPPIEAMRRVREQLAAATARAEKAEARLAELGERETEQRIIGVSGLTSTPTQFDLEHRADWCPGVRLEERQVYATPWRNVEQEPEPRLQCGCLGFCEGGPECLDDEGGPWPQEREVPDA